MASHGSTRLSQPHAGLIDVDKLDAIGNAVHVMRVLSAGRFSPFGPVGMAHLPHGPSEMLSNRCHGAIDVDLM
jgi:hypothetical protein